MVTLMVVELKKRWPSRAEWPYLQLEIMIKEPCKGDAPDSRTSVSSHYGNRQASKTPSIILEDLFSGPIYSSVSELLGSRGQPYSQK